MGSAGKEVRNGEKNESGAELHPRCLLHVLSSHLLTSLSAPMGLLGTRLFLLAGIFFLCAPVSPRTGANTHLKAVPSQKITTTQVRRRKQEAVRKWAPHVNQAPPTPSHLILCGA